MYNTIANSPVFICLLLGGLFIVALVANALMDRFIKPLWMFEEPEEEGPDD